MNIQITSTLRTENGCYFTATCDKVSARVSIHKWGLQVVCENSAHKAWRGAGRFFQTPAEALANYRSSQMKAIIQAAIDYSIDL